MVKGNKEGHYIMMIGSIHQKVIMIILHAQHWKTEIHKAKTDRPKRRNKQDFNTPLSTMDRSSRQNQ